LIYPTTVNFFDAKILLILLILIFNRRGETCLDNEEEKEEIIVKAPSKPVVSSEKKIEKATEKALEEERYNVMQINKKIGKYTGASSAIIGAILLVMFAYVSITSQGSLALLTSTASTLIIGLWVAVGLISVVVGFLLMGSE